MAAVLLDTTVLIDFLRGRLGGRARLEALRDAGDVPLTSPVNVEEVARGLRSEREREGARRLFEAIRVRPLRAGEGWQAGEWRRAFADRGVTLSQADCLVAAAAYGAGARLATGNPRHFPMEELTVEHWPVEA